MQFNPDAVERFLTFGDLEPLDTADPEAADNLDVKGAVVLGSTLEQTTIYASIDKQSEGLAEQAAHDTLRLLQFMGATAIIDQPPTPDA